MVVVNNHLKRLPVALSRGENDSSSVFEHWDKIRNHDSLSEEVFCCLKQSWALPFPHLFVVIEIASMTCPHTKVLVAEAVLYLYLFRYIRHPWFAFVFDIAPSVFKLLGIAVE